MLGAAQAPANEQNKTQPQAEPAPKKEESEPYEQHNVMADVIERHECIANRARNRRR